MTTRQMKVYPSERNSQRSNEATVPLSWALAYLRTVSASIPEAEREKARIEGWTGLSVWHEHTLSQEEVVQERIERARAALAQGAREGLSAEQVREIYKLLAQP